MNVQLDPLRFRKTETLDKFVNLGDGGYTFQSHRLHHFNHLIEMIGIAPWAYGDLQFQS